MYLNKEVLTYAKSQKNKLLSLTSKNSDNGIWSKSGLNVWKLSTVHHPRTKATAFPGLDLPPSSGGMGKRREATTENKLLAEQNNIPKLCTMIINKGKR